MNYRQPAGFTLVELVVVILLLGILSYATIPLFASKSAYTSRLAADLLVGQLQLAQRIALGMSAQNNPVTVQVIVGSGSWDYALQKTGQTPYIINADSSNALLRVNGTALNVGDSVSFTWNSAANLTVASNYEFLFEGETTQRVCLSATGYAYKSEGACL